MGVFRAVVGAKGVGCESTEDKRGVVEDSDSFGGAQSCIDYVDGEGKEDEVDGGEYGEPKEG